LSYSRNGTLLGERQTPPRWSSADPIDESDDTAKTAVPYYRWRIAVSEDGKRSWFRGEDSIDCLDENGAVLASISAVPGLRGVRVSKDFAQVLVVTEKDLDPVSVERYEVPKPCRP
jgi:hypothetical protein